MTRECPFINVSRPSDLANDLLALVSKDSAEQVQALNRLRRMVDDTLPDTDHIVARLSDRLRACRQEKQDEWGHSGAIYNALNEEEEAIVASLALLGGLGRCT